MKKLSIKLNKQHKSFEYGFLQDLYGDLIILSGVNGSGKTQLMEIMRGYTNHNRDEILIRDLVLNDQKIDGDQVFYKSFRDYAGIDNLTAAHVVSKQQARDQLYNWYSRFKLDYNNNECRDYRSICRDIKQHLITKLGADKFNSNIPRQEFDDNIPVSFVLYRDDIFTNKIGELFFSYVSEVKNAKAKIGEDILTGKTCDTSKFKSLPKAPWIVLNELFKDLSFDYRFRDHYERNDADQINEQPTIYAVGEDGKIDESQKRSLQDLSDGEKAIISLTFAVIASNQVKPKILVLDEYDAPLNPSLIKAFFIVLERFFIKEGIQVIISTHSSATLSLAPECAKFYEVYKKKQNRPRILEVSREDYEEMKIANERFYKALEEKENNIKNLESSIQADRCLQVITEGNNVAHIEHAIQILKPELLEKIKVISGAEGNSGKQQLKNAFTILSCTNHNTKFLFVWDTDAEDLIRDLSETDKYFKFCFSKNSSNRYGGIENIYETNFITDDLFDVKTEQHSSGESTKRLISKSRFLQKVKQQKDQKFFSGFEGLIKKIESILHS